MFALFLSFFDTALDFLEIIAKLKNIANSQNGIDRVPKLPKNFRKFELR